MKDDIQNYLPIVMLRGTPCTSTQIYQRFIVFPMAVFQIQYFPKILKFIKLEGRRICFYAYLLNSILLYCLMFNFTNIQHRIRALCKTDNSFFFILYKNIKYEYTSKFQT